MLMLVYPLLSQLSIYKLILNILYTVYFLESALALSLSYDLFKALSSLLILNSFLYVVLVLLYLTIFYADFYNFGLF
jgi:hypothetical protein